MSILNQLRRNFFTRWQHGMGRVFGRERFVRVPRPLLDGCRPFGTADLAMCLKFPV
jgi:hypothetical protein